MSSPDFVDKGSYSKSNKGCCGFMDLKAGAKVIIALIAVHLIISLVSSFAPGYPIKYTSTILVIHALVIGCLIAAVFTKKAKYVLPVLFVQIISVYFYTVFLINELLQYIVHEDTKLFAQAIILAVFNIPSNLWSSVMAYKFYKHLKENAQLVLPSHNY